MIVYGSKPTTSHCTMGGKAAGLFKLREAGVSVPDFLVIPAETFDGILQSVDSQPGNSAVSIRQKLSGFDFPRQDLKKIGDILSDWSFPAQAVVVRSSVADEDGEKNAFPGMMDSFMNLTSWEDVMTAVRQCAASAYSDRAISYRTQMGLPPQARPAVIIQQQVAPLASGVLFTTFPEYPQEMAIHAVWGFGEGLVSGKLEADEFYYLKKTGSLHRQTLVRKEQQYLAQSNHGTQLVEVDATKQSLACLSPAQLQELFTIGTLLEQHFAGPQDVEFVVNEERVFVVQSRPITQAIPEVVIYDNSNIQESYCGVTTPLTFSFAQRAYATVYRQTMQTLGLPNAVIQTQEPVITQLLGLVKGRIYYNINNWYRGLQLLPSFKQNKDDMERMMGLEDPVDFVQSQEKTLGQKLQILPGLLLNLSRLLWAFFKLKKRVPIFHAHFQKHYRQFYQHPLTNLSSQGLLSQKALLDKELLGNWTTPIINDFYVMMMNGKVVRKLKKAGILSTDEFLSRYLSGDKQIESTQPTRAMQRLAAKARQQPNLREIILALPKDLHNQIQPLFPEFHREVEAFLDSYGDRTVGELKLETVTMRIQPFIFYKYLKNYLVTDTHDALVTESNTTLHLKAVKELTLLLKGQTSLFAQSVWKSLAQLQQAIRYRESLRLERTRLFGMYRGLYIAVGEKLVNNNVITSARDVFYLTEKEIIQAAGGSETENLAALVNTRRIEFEQYKKEDAPSRITVPSPPILLQTTPLENPHLLQGTGCFPGMVSGEVLVITDPDSNLDVNGKIICALRTDPGWAALFPTCLGVLIEKGSALSHSVILLRELGMPTIINIPGLTKRLQTGQRITMNSSTGEITILFPFNPTIL